jgi:DNA-binding SARP family transcriptional activator/predicted ATPase
MLKIRLFGGLQITLDGAPAKGFISAKAPALLAYLACEQRPCPREELAALLWGEMPEADAKNNLRQALSNLRRLAGDYLRITRSDAALREAAPLWLDAARFEAYLPESADPAGWEAAVSLYRGDFMAGVVLRDAPRFEEWLLARRARYRELALYAWHNLTEHYLRRRAYGRAIDSAGRLLELDPWREEAHRQLMRALVYSGQRAAALRRYETCRRVLADGLGAAPSGETTLLYERIRAAGERPPHNLPAPAAPFIGREEDLARIEAWLEAEDGRLLTITGLGGAGKTRLALHAARAHTADFLEGVWFVPLAAVPPGGSLVPAAAAAVGCQLSSGRPELQLLDYLSGRELLLILDNAEHLLTRANLDFLAELAAGAPAVKLLVTSRKRLNLRAETVWELAGLPHAEAAGSPAAQLFVERTRRVRPGFDPAGQEAALARLCRLTGGLPLALELAAAWTRALDLPGIVTEIERGLDFLAADWPDLPERQRSLQTVFDYSWQTLTPREQAAYARLALFRGGFTAEAARETAEAALPLLAGLVDKSLLRLEDSGRYRRHPLLLQFAAQKLAADPADREAARRKYARFYGRFMRRIEPLLFGGRVEEALSRIRPELENLRRAWEAAVELEETAVLNDLIRSFFWVFDLLGLYREGLALAEGAIAALEAAAPDEMRRLVLGQAYGLAAGCAFRLGDGARTETAAQAAMSLLAPFRPHAAYGHSLLCAGAAAYGRVDVAAAAKLWRQAAAAYREAGSLWGECAAQCNQAEAALTLEDMAAARRYAAAAAALARRLGNNELLATALQILAAAARQEKDFAQALAYGREAAGLHRRVGHKAQEANALAGLSRIAADQGDYRQALAWLTECVTILRQAGSRAQLNWRLAGLAETALAAGEREMAAAAAREVLAQPDASPQARQAAERCLGKIGG